MLIQYLKYLLKAQNEHGFHSPFVYKFYLEVIKPDKILPEFKLIEAKRRSLKQSEEIIEMQDFGAGSKLGAFKNRKVCEIAKNAEKPAKWARLLFRLVQFQKPKVIFDLGTCLGTTTSYMLVNNAINEFYSFEGCPNLIKRAQENINESRDSNVKFIQGNLDITLRETLNQLNQPLDFVFFDANHQYIPTINYFEMCLEKANENSLFIFDDIYWSHEMTLAWEYIKNNKDVTVTIDLFQIGLVFFRKEQVKEHFVARY